MAWTSLLNTVSGSSQLTQDFLRRLVENIRASGANVIRANGDILYANGSNELQRLSMSDGQLGNFVSVGSDSTIVWRDIAVNLDYRAYIANPALYNSEVPDTSVITKESGLNFIEAVNNRLSSELLQGVITGADYNVETIGTLGEFTPRIQRYRVGSRVGELIQSSDATAFSVRMSGTDLVWDFDDTDIHRIGFAHVSSVDGDVSHYILDVRDGDRVPDFEVLASYLGNDSVGYKLDSDWSVSKNSLENLASGRVNFLAYSSIPTLDVTTALRSTSSGASSIGLTWNSVLSATRYEIQGRLSSADDFSSVSTSETSTSITVTSIGGRSLVANTRYVFRVRALGSNVVSGRWSDELTVVTQLPTLSTPTGLFASSIGATSVSIRFNAVTNADSYTIEYGTTSASSITTTSTSRTISGLSANTVYFFRVKATAAGYVDSSFTSDISVTTLQRTLGTPSTSVSVISSTDVRLSWGRVTDAISYIVQWRSSAESYGTSRQTTTTGTSYTVSGYVGGTTVYVRVRATASGYQDSVWAEESITTTVAPLPTLGSPSITAWSSSVTGSFTLDWDAVTSATSYTVQWRLSSQSYSTTRQATTASTVYNGSDATWSSGDTVYARVKATASGYQDSVWAESSYTITVPTLSVPTISTFSLSTAGILRANWSAVSDATSYDWQIRLSSDVYGATRSVSSTSLNLNLSPFAPVAGSTYYFRVRATASGYQDSAWAESSHTVVLPRLSAPGLSDFIVRSSGGFNFRTTRGTAIVGVDFIMQWRSSSQVYSTSRQSRFDATTGSHSFPSRSTGVTPVSGTTYYLRIKATASGYQDSAWAEDSYTYVVGSSHSGAEDGRAPLLHTIVPPGAIAQVRDYPLGFFYAYTIDTISTRVVPIQPRGLAVKSGTTASVVRSEFSVNAESGNPSGTTIEYQYRNAYVDDPVNDITRSWRTAGTGGVIENAPVVSILDDTTGHTYHLGHWIEIRARAVSGSSDVAAVLRYSPWTPSLFINLAGT